MKPAEKTTSICVSCGTTFEPMAAETGCPACLLQLGVGDDVEENAEFPEAVPDHLGTYAIARNEDGSPCELGRGAMGVTYRAIDTSLNREVALKIIRAGIGLSNAEARERFAREARTAAALRHPNVATVYQFGISEETGQCFCAMELIAGENLEDRVRRSGPMGAASVVEIARQITAALIEAEERGLVHRDLKPANIMVQSPRNAEAKPAELTVKIIDFGIAKALTQTPDARVLTGHGFIGTPAFASPEQFSGESVDGRSDIYSLGATLWFLLTGHMPFGDRLQPKPGEKANPVPLPIEQLKAARVPSSLIALLSAMLTIEPAGRPGVRELAKKLDEIQTHLAPRRNPARRLAFAAVALALAAGGAWFLFHPAGTSRSPASESVPGKSIAVLPLKNLSVEKENLFFADGLQDEILTNLARLADLKVISRNSVQQYSSSEARDVQQIARDLGVVYVLEGSVEHIADELRVKMELIDTRKNTQVWEYARNRKAADFFVMQSEIARAVADQLQAKLSPGESAAMDRPPTTSLAAYALYLKARAAMENPSTEPNWVADFAKGEELLQEAIRADPNFVLAYCELANIYDLRYWMQVDSSPECRARADAAVETATRLAPDSGEVHLARAVHFYHGYRQYRWARTEFALAKEKLPNEPRVYENIAYLDRREGHWDDAVKNLRHAFALNPSSMDARFNLADLYISLGWFKEVRELLRPVPATAVWGQNKKDYLADVDFLEKGDMSTRMSMTPEKTKDGLIPFWNLKSAVYARDAERAGKVLAAMPSDYFPPHTFLYWKAATEQVRGDRPAMLRLYGEARAAAAKASQEDPNDAELWGALGLYDAVLGDKEEALKEGQRATEILPLEQDSVRGMELAVNMVYIYGWVGEKDRAFEELQRLMKIPRGPRYGHLRYYPQYDPLRDDPRFQKILASVAPKQANSN